MTPSGAPLYRRIAFIGFGLIASSMARAIRALGLADSIAGCARSAATRDRVRELGLADSIHDDPAAAAAGADLVVVATPLSAYSAVGRALGGALAEDATLTDVGSVKQSAIRDLGPYVPDHAHFIPGHPIAGTEHSGPDAGFAELFHGRWCILTPIPGTDRDSVRRLESLWTALGSRVTEMEPAHHDKVLAITSHLPHIIAYTIVGTATDLSEDLKQEVISYSASGFRDFTRIAASDPEMWRDVFLNNREAVLEMLQRFNEDLTTLQRAIRWGEADVLYDYFSRTRDIRRRIIEAKQAD